MIISVVYHNSLSGLSAWTCCIYSSMDILGIWRRLHERIPGKASPLFERRFWCRPSPFGVLLCCRRCGCLSGVSLCRISPWRRTAAAGKSLFCIPVAVSEIPARIFCLRIFGFGTACAAVYSGGRRVSHLLSCHFTGKIFSVTGSDLCPDRAFPDRPGFSGSAALSGGARVVQCGKCFCQNDKPSHGVWYAVVPHTSSGPVFSLCDFHCSGGSAEHSARAAPDCTPDQVSLKLRKKVMS